MLLSEIWLRGNIPQELKDIILDLAIPTRLLVRVHPVQSTISAENSRLWYAVEMSDLLQWHSLNSLMSHSEEVKKIVLRKLNREGVLVIVERNSRAISSRESNRMLHANVEVLRACKWAEVSEPYSILFSRARGQRAHGCTLLKFTARVQIPDFNTNHPADKTDFPTLASEVKWEIDRTSSSILEPKALDWATTLVEPYAVDIIRAIQQRLHKTNNLHVRAFLDSASRLAVYLGSECGNSTAEYEFEWETREDARMRLAGSTPQWEEIDIREMQRTLMAQFEAEKQASQLQEWGST